MQDYPLEKIQEITWVDKELIREAARMYATTKPAAIHWGVPTEQTNQLCRLHAHLDRADGRNR